ncbi:hypothetical protein JD844_004565 [Phrynosoma platyrhinos]|uniref:Uncharacterized protein n=1 Tax=Phrynosoma platyrhinos TaxID=52577 RepID=A0ABQ7SDH7_PHRPL|nr:hypothetical protein JD844_004565 [Phrynosoma platyrhinos]
MLGQLSWEPKAGGLNHNIINTPKSVGKLRQQENGREGGYPHDVVNHLSCDEARNHYGGVVSLIPIVLDCMKEWVAHSEKLPRNMMQSVSARRAAIYQQLELPNLNVGPRNGLPPFVTEGTQTSLSLTEKARSREKRGEAKLKEMGTLRRAIHKFLDGPWRPPGKNAF